jgi:hypothetical protein
MLPRVLITLSTAVSLALIHDPIAGGTSLSASAATAQSGDVTFIVQAPGSPTPSVALTAPVNGDRYDTPANVFIQAAASDDTGVSRVDFYANGQLIGSDATSPYEFLWTNAPSGVYQLAAVATNAGGAQATSPVVNLGIKPLPGPVNLARGQRVYASSSADGSSGPDAAVDGNAATRWASAPGDGQWLYVDLGYDIRVDHFVLRWSAAYPSRYRVQTNSNPSYGNWTDLYVDDAGDGGVDEIHYGLFTQYLRVLCVQQATASGCSLDEFEVYRDVDTAPQPATPTVIGPANETTGNRLDPALDWSGVGDLYFGTTDPPPLFAGNMRTSTYRMTSLAPNTTYYWRIVARNDTGSTTGPVWWFATGSGTAPPTPPTVQNTSPPNGTTGVSTRPTITWSSSGDRDDVYFGTANPPPYADFSQNRSYSPGLLAANTTYYWRIVSTNSVGSTNGPIWQFTTEPPPTGPPGPPSNPSPADAATSVGTNPTLTWTSAEATSHKVYLGKTPSPPFVTTVSSPSYQAGPLATATTYFWHIESQNSSAASGGGIWRFTTAPAFPGEGNIVIDASDIPSSSLHGSWSVASDESSPGGVKLITPDNGWSTTDAPLAAPTDYVDVTFNAPANTYHVWVRLKATGDTKWSDAVWIQLSDGQTPGCCSGAPYRIGTTGGLLVNLEPCSGCGVAGWGWQDAAWWTGQSPLVTFDRDDAHTIRIQVREDGVQFDQIVLSPAQFMAAAPGPVKNDATIVPK